MSNAKPLFLVKPGTMTREDIKRAERMACVCIVECTEPESARYMNAPLIGDGTAMSAAALRVMEWASKEGGMVDRKELARWFTQLLLAQPKAVEKVKA